MLCLIVCSYSTTCLTNLKNKNTLPPLNELYLSWFLEMKCNWLIWCVITLFRVSNSNGSSMHVLPLLIYLSWLWSVVYSTRRMGRKNYEICHSCKVKGHSFANAHKNVDAYYASMDSRSISWWRKRRSTQDD